MQSIFADDFSQENATFQSPVENCRRDSLKPRLRTVGSQNFSPTIFDEKIAKPYSTQCTSTPICSFYDDLYGNYDQKLRQLLFKNKKQKSQPIKQSSRKMKTEKFIPISNLQKKNLRKTTDDQQSKVFAKKTRKATEIPQQKGFTGSIDRAIGTVKEGSNSSKESVWPKSKQTQYFTIKSLNQQTSSGLQKQLETLKQLNNDRKKNILKTIKKVGFTNLSNEKLSFYLKQPRTKFASNIKYLNGCKLGETFSAKLKTPLFLHQLKSRRNHLSTTDLRK